MAKAENIIPADFEDIARAVRQAWGADTSSFEGWTEDNPEQGQCAVVALLVQYGYGGVLRRAIINGESHYWNEIDGVTVDLTRSQFHEPLIAGDSVERERDYVLSFPDTAKRYEILLDRVRI
jgi:hypothetical protein